MGGGRGHVSEWSGAAQRVRCSCKAAPPRLETVCTHAHEVFDDSVEYEPVVVSCARVRAEVLDGLRGVFAEEPEVTESGFQF